MQQPFVKSTALSRVSYDATSAFLEVEFHDHRIYGYCDVPGELYAALLRAESKGKFFNAEIRDRFRFVPVTGCNGPRPA
jgi:lysyl-tRNA synthetase class 2